MPEDQKSVSRLVLVRHARPVVDPNTPPESWELEADAMDAVRMLAEALRDVSCDGVVVSPESKARRTGEALAARLELPITVDSAFCEQGGGRVPFLSDDVFLATVAAHFERPDEIVFGTESSHRASERFDTGIQRVSAQMRCPVVVTHGRVMCGYLARTFSVDPVPIWRSLRLPDAFIVDLSAGTFWRIDVPEEGRKG